MFRIVPAGPGRERRPSPFWDPGPALCLSYHKLPEDATGCAGARRAGGCGPRNDKNGRKRKARAQEGPVSQRDVRGLGAAACRPPNPRKTDPQRPALLTFRDGKAPCLAAPAPCHAGGCGPGNDKNGCKRKARAQEGPVPQRDMRGLGAAACRPPNPRKTDPQRPALLAFRDGKAPCLAAPALCHAGSYEPGNDKNGCKRKARAQEGPVPQRDVRGLGAAACRPPNPRKTDPQRPALLVFGDGKAPCLAAPVPCRAGGCGPGNDKNGCKRKARAQEGPCPAAGCARLGRGNLPPKQLPVKAADFSFTAGNLAEALNPFFIFDKIQEGKSKHRPLSCKHNRRFGERK